MKILHICTGYNLDYNGGITNYVRSIAEMQADNGHDVYVLSDGGTSLKYKVVDFKSRVATWSYYKGSDKKSLKWLKSFLDENQFDLIHLHMMLNIDQNLYDVLRDRKYIVSLHDYYYICPRLQMMPPLENKRCEFASIEKCGKCFSVIEKNRVVLRAVKKLFGDETACKFPIKSKKVYSKWLEKNKQLLENAKLLLPVSKRVEEIYRNSGIVNEYRVLHIGNISAENFDEIAPKKSYGAINLVLLSNVSKAKGGPLFFDILKKVNNPLIKVHFYGRSNKNEKSIFSELGIEDHGPYKQTDLSHILAEMDMGVMTPIWEDNGPQVVMEMLNNHLPIFGTRMGGIPDFVNEKNGFLFDPYDESDIDRAVDFLNSLTPEKIAYMRSNIQRTLSPTEHFFELMACYDLIK